VGAWGPGIFSDDTTADIRSDYRELLEDHVPDEEARRRVLDQWTHLVGSDEEHLLWLALAGAQWQVGRLDDDVKARAIRVIDAGAGLELWAEVGPKALAQRRSALAKFRAQLSGPEPARKTLRRPWRHATDLVPGQVLVFRAANDQAALLRVARVDEHRIGVAPIVEWLDWSGDTVPSERKIRRMRPRIDTRFRPPRPVTYRVARHRRKDPDWSDVGFSVAEGVTLTRSGDEQCEAWNHFPWSGLKMVLERELAEAVGK